MKKKNRYRLQIKQVLSLISLSNLRVQSLNHKHYKCQHPVPGLLVMIWQDFFVILALEWLYKKGIEKRATAIK
jgi:hypothetical protein